MRGRAGRCERALARGERALIEGDLGTDSPEPVDPGALGVGTSAASEGVPAVGSRRWAPEERVERVVGTGEVIRVGVELREERRPPGAGDLLTDRPVMSAVFDYGRGERLGTEVSG